MRSRQPLPSAERAAPLAHCATFPVLGVALEVRSNAAEAIALAHESFGAWLHLPPELWREAATARLDVIVEPLADLRRAPEAPVYRRRGPVFLAVCRRFACRTSIAERHAVCRVSPTTLADPDYYRWYVNGLGVFAATLAGRTPFHAATVVGRDVALVLAGPSGAGKSTLAYACHRAGFAVLSDEVLHVGPGPEHPRLWGWTEAITLAPAARRFFPELAGERPVDRPNGKRRLVLPVAAHDVRLALTCAGRVVVCMLDRHASATTVLQPATPGEVERVLGQDAEGFSRYDRRAALAWLLAQPGCSLRVGRDPHEAAGRLVSLAASLGE